MAASFRIPFSLIFFGPSSCQSRRFLGFGKPFADDLLRLSDLVEKIIQKLW